MMMVRQNATSALNNASGCPRQFPVLWMQIYAILTNTPSINEEGIVISGVQQGLAEKMADQFDLELGTEWYNLSEEDRSANTLKKVEELMGLAKTVIPATTTPLISNLKISNISRRLSGT
jgi:hypothetical protein